MINGRICNRLIYINHILIFSHHKITSSMFKRPLTWETGSWTKSATKEKHLEKHEAADKGCWRKQTKRTCVVRQLQMWQKMTSKATILSFSRYLTCWPPQSGTSWSCKATTGFKRNMMWEKVWMQWSFSDFVKPLNLSVLVDVDPVQTNSQIHTNVIFHS